MLGGTAVRGIECRADWSGLPDWEWAGLPSPGWLARLSHKQRDCHACPAVPCCACAAVLCLLSQVYGGLVEMDFDASHMQLYGHGRYEPMDPCLLPPQPHLQLIYSSAAPSGKDSGSVHSDVRQRWLAGDATVRWARCWTVLGGSGVRSVTLVAALREPHGVPAEQAEMPWHCPRAFPALPADNSCSNWLSWRCRAGRP
jgi:hypothetical protein